MSNARLEFYNRQLEAAKQFRERVIPDFNGIHKITSIEFTRPANTTAYAAKDVVGDGNVIEFPSCGREPGGNGYITRVKLVTTQAANVNLYRLHMYKRKPTAIADNAPFTGVLWADRDVYLGHIDFDALVTGGSGTDTAYQQDVALRFQYDCADGDDKLYGILEVTAAFTPDSAQKYYIELAIDQN